MVKGILCKQPSVNIRHIQNHFNLLASIKIFFKKFFLINAFKKCLISYIISFKLKDSKIPTYQKMWKYMDYNRHVFVKKYEHGVQRVLEGKFEVKANKI